MIQALTPSPPRGCAAVMLEVFRAQLRELGLPLTHQREAIARVLFESTTHLSADDIGERLRQSDQHIGKATIYRTLKLLVKVGLSAEHDFDEGFKRYELRVGPAHYEHLICTSCGSVTEFERLELDTLQNEVAAAFGFQALTRQLKIYGTCAECAAGSTGSYSRLA